MNILETFKQFEDEGLRTNFLVRQVVELDGTFHSSKCKIVTRNYHQTGKIVRGEKMLLSEVIKLRENFCPNCPGSLSDGEGKLQNYLGIVKSRWERLDAFLRPDALANPEGAYRGFASARRNIEWLNQPKASWQPKTPKFLDDWKATLLRKASEEKFFKFLRENHHRDIVEYILWSQSGFGAILRDGEGGETYDTAREIISHMYEKLVREGQWCLSVIESDGINGTTVKDFALGFFKKGAFKSTMVGRYGGAVLVYHPVALTGFLEKKQLKLHRTHQSSALIERVIVDTEPTDATLEVLFKLIEEGGEMYSSLKQAMQAAENLT